MTTSTLLHAFASILVLTGCSTIQVYRPPIQRPKPPQSLIEQHLVPLQHDPQGRWPILVWQRPPESMEVLETLLAAGISPMFTGGSTFRRSAGRAEVIQQLRRLQARGMPIVILPQGLVQSAFRDDGGSDHDPPARPHRVDPIFRCPARFYDNPDLDRERSISLAMAQDLRNAGITPASIWLDFETGAYLRNRYEVEENVLLAMREAERCASCRARFGPYAFESPEAYSRAVDRGRARAIRYAFVEPVRSVFRDVHLGNFFAYPHNRIEQPPDIYPAHGYETSGMNVAMPRVYFIPGWGGNARSSQEEVNWNIFRSSVSHFSAVGAVLQPGEKLVPWVAYGFRGDNAIRRARAGGKIASSEAYREMVRHVLMRGAETIAIFASTDFDEPFPPEYPPDFDRRELGQFLVNVVDVQQAYDEMLAFNEHLRRGRVLNYEIDGENNRLDESAAVWSGVATDERALIRTVSFGPELRRKITVFDREVELPFERVGRFFWVYPDGRIESVERGRARIAAN